VLVLALVTWRTVVGNQSYEQFKEYDQTADRQREFKRWLVESLALYGGLAVVVVLITGDTYKDVLANAGEVVGADSAEAIFGDGSAAIIGFGCALVGGVFLGLYLQTRDKEREPTTVGDIAHLLPRNRQELTLTGLLSINAGVVEELFFRLALPALLLAATGNTSVAVIGSVVVFALVHWYQGPIGIVFTLIMGGFLMAIYLASGYLVLAMILHAFIDLRSLYIAPLIRMRRDQRAGS